MIPVSVVTGFLGSGKTTLIARLLRDPAFARTAVIVNEYGEIGLDHDLIAEGNENFLTLTTGCLCCVVRSDLVETLLDLTRSAAGRYDRVLIETSGLADPGPILQALMTAEGHGLDTLITVVDPVHGEASLTDFAEARAQVALADVLLISKTDITSPAGSLLIQLSTLNPGAPRANCVGLSAERLFAGADPAAHAARLDTRAAAPAVHTGGIETISWRRDTPLPALALTLWLQALAEHCGGKLLRMKGLIAIAEMPGQPAVVHGVRHVFSAPVFLDAWPSDDRSTRLVFIYQDMPRYFPARLLDAIEEETRDELAAARDVQ